jgi:hypothetical protein
VFVQKVLLTKENTDGLELLRKLYEHGKKYKFKVCILIYFRHDDASAQHMSRHWDRGPKLIGKVGGSTWFGAIKKDPVTWTNLSRVKPEDTTQFVLQCGSAFMAFTPEAGGSSPVETVEGGEGQLVHAGLGQKGTQCISICFEKPADMGVFSDREIMAEFYNG